MLKPRKLQPGDRIAAVTLSWGGPGAFPQRYAAGKAQLVEAFGVDVVEMPHALRDPAWLAAHPDARAADLMDAFADPSIHGIVSTIGGDDSIRILPFLDLDVIASNPKVFLGYSDTTVAHLACRRAGLVSFYGPSVMSGFAENVGMFPYMTESVRRICFSATPPGVLEPCRDGWTAERLEWGDPGNQQRRRRLHAASGWRFIQGVGRVHGRLLGGCLEVLDWLRGSVVWPEPRDFDGAILFIETSNEAPTPHAVARMLRSLAAIGALRRLSGLLVGRPGGDVTEAAFAAHDEAILDIVARQEGLAELPIVTRMDFGHTDPMLVLPYGILAEIDCDRQQVAIVESAVRE